MHKRFATVGLALILLALFALAAAQAPGWSAWLYDPDSGQMTLVDSTGVEQQTFRLPTPISDQILFPFDVAVSPGGTRVAYILAVGEDFQQTLFVYDITTRGISAQLQLPPDTFANSLGLVATPQVFNPDETEVALGFNRSSGAWQLIVMSLQGRGVVATLGSSDEVVLTSDIPVGINLIPVVQHYDGTALTFMMVRAGTEGLPQYESFTWNIAQNTILGDVTYPTMNYDTLAGTGEIVSALQDLRLANRNPDFLGFQSNALHVFDPKTGGRFPFYNDPNRAFFFPRFVQNGERLLVGFNTVDTSEPRWMVIERDGSLVGTLPPGFISTAMGLSDGFIYLHEPATAEGKSILRHVITRDGLDGGVPIWEAAAGSFPRIVWARDERFVASSALPPWPQLAEPVFAPTAPGAGGGTTEVVLAVDVQATVNTTEGDPLNIRSGPGLNFEVVAQASAGMRVTLLEGPLAADGFRWWRIESADRAVSGWAVESADGVRTLLPT